MCHTTVNATNLPRPDVNHHVMLVSHADDVFVVGREGHTGDAIFVLLELRHMPALCNVPQSHRWQVAALMERKDRRRVRQDEVRGNSEG